MSFSSVASYIAGQCTAFVAQTLSWVPGGWGNAAQWFSNAQKSGFSTGQAPAVGSIAVWGANEPGSGGDGHVAVVTAVDQAANTITVQEQNYLYGPGKTDTRTINLSSNPAFLGFIYAPGSAPSSAGYWGNSSSSSSGGNYWGTNPLSGLEAIFGGITGLTAAQQWATRAVWALLAMALVTMGLVLLFFDGLKDEFEKHPELFEDAAEVAV